MPVLTSWTAVDKPEVAVGARDLLGTGAIADGIADEIAPNLRQSTMRARYYTMLAVGTRDVEEAADTSAGRLRRFFRWERLWLASLLASCAKKSSDLRAQVKKQAPGLLGTGIGGRSIQRFEELWPGWTTKGIDLGEFVPLQAPQTSGAYGRYAGSARESGLLSRTSGLALEKAGRDLVAAFEDSRSQQFVSSLRAALDEARPGTSTTLFKSHLPALGLDRPKLREREILIERLLEGVSRTLLAARVVGAELGRAAEPSEKQWSAAIPACAKRAAAIDDEGKRLSDALLAAAGYDPFRKALEETLLTVSDRVAASGEWSVDEKALANDPKILERVAVIDKAARRFLASPEVEATSDLRGRVKDASCSTVGGVLALLAAQHAAVCAARFTGAWFTRRDTSLAFVRRISGAPGNGLGRYRLASLASLMSDLQWKVKS